MPQTPANSQTRSTQNSLLISEVKDGIVVMQDGSLRAVVLASAINFDLMSGQEQNAVEYSYQGFLNSLHFPIQINIRSQKIDLDGYIERLGGLRSGQTNLLLGELMDDYIANIRGLVEEVNIMDKRFYVTIPYFPPMTIVKTGLVSNMATIFKPAASLMTVGAADFDRYKIELRQRVQQVVSGLGQIGIRSIPLNTQELIELYYAYYNPDVAVNQKLTDAGEFQTAAVTRGGPAVVAPAAPVPQPAPIAYAEPIAPATAPSYAPASTYTPPPAAQPSVAVLPPAPATPSNQYDIPVPPAAPITQQPASPASTPQTPPQQDIPR